jgi:PST family polysaccharide transporter
MLLALIGAALFWLASGWIARVILADETRTTDVAWLSLGVAITVAAGSQGALLAGLRRIGDLARINVGSGIIGAALGVLALLLWGAQGLIAMVLVAPIVTFLLGHAYVVRIGKPAGPSISLAEMSHEWRALVTLGFAFMLSGLVTTVSHLAVRTIVQRDLGTEALGHFQAAWSIGMTYLGFVLGAMGKDYLPRLAAEVKNPANATRLVNEQTEVAMLLCAPALLAMLGLAPWVIRLLYSAEFGPATEILRWQLMGDIFKVMSWPLGFILLASGAGKTFIITETLGMAVFVIGVLILLPIIGISATGVAFLMLYIAYLPLVRWLSGRLIRFQWTHAVKAQALTIVAAAGLVDIIARCSEILGALLGIMLAGVFSFYALIRLSRMAGLGGRIGKMVVLGDNILKRFGLMR